MKTENLPLSSRLDIPACPLQIERGLQNRAAGLLALLGFGGRMAVVSDANTYMVLGKRIENQLPKCISVVLPDGVKPTLETVGNLQEAFSECDAVVAVGSGTINDLCKYTSFISGKRYAVFGTAPSMNGYSSANASLIVNGYRTSRMAQLPSGIFLDLDILVAAPKRLIQSGLGDALCRPTAQADWLLSHLLLGTPYKQEPFELLQPYEHALLAQAAGLVRGDLHAVELLAHTLVLSGAGMYRCGGSYPASQGEHMIAHTMEMVHGDTLPAHYHGEEIGVTTLTMAELQERALQSNSRELAKKILHPAQGSIARYFPHAVAAECLAAYDKKLTTMGDRKALAAKLTKEWPEIQEKLRAVTVPTATLRKALDDAGAPATPAALGWPQGAYTGAVAHAKYSRDRFTFLDLV